MQAMDTDKARKIIEGDAAINRKRFQIEDRCLTLIATQQPMARDMRLLAAILEIAGELERIGDYGKGIGRIIVYMNGNAPIKKLIDIPRMETIAHAMLDKAMVAFINRDVALAQSVPPIDDEVDALYNQVNRDLLSLLQTQPERRGTGQPSALGRAQSGTLCRSRHQHLRAHRVHVYRRLPGGRCLRVRHERRELKSANRKSRGRHVRFAHVAPSLLPLQI